MRSNMRPSILTFILSLLMLPGCGDKRSSTAEATKSSPQAAMTEAGIKPVAKPEYAPTNPYLADSVMPIGHFNSGQTSGVEIAGPTGPSADLSMENGDLTYTHLGPGHFGMAISGEYPNGKRVIWSNGAERISKLDYDTLEVISEYFLEDSPIYKNNQGPISAEQADSDIKRLDRMPTFRNSGMLTVMAGIPLAKEYYGAGLAGVYFLLSSDNVLYVGGKDSIIAYADEDPSDPKSPIIKKAEWRKPAEIKGGFNSMNITYDGWIVSTSDDGWVVMIKRDFSDYRSMQLSGAEVAAAWNQHMLDIGRRQGAATWVRNAPAIDNKGNIFVASLQHMHKIVWNGDQLSKNPVDGAWVEPYSNKGDITVSFDDIIDPSSGKPFTFTDVNVGTGATVSLLGFGDEDKFAVITDGDKLMNMTYFWREDIPEGWKQLPNAPSRRIAGMLPANFGDPNRIEAQTEQSVIVGGYGTFVVNNAPASKPLEKAPDGAYTGLAGFHPDFTPYGVQKFEWDPHAQELQAAWVNTEASSPNSAPMVSTGSNVVYTMGAHDGQWTLQGIDWMTGKTKFMWTIGSSRYNTQYSGILIDQEGRIVHTTIHGIVRYERN